MGKKFVWATTPEAKAKTTEGRSGKELKMNDCEKMRRARKMAEQVTKELREEREKESTASPSEMTGE